MLENKTLREYMEDYDVALAKSGMKIATRLQNIERANKLVLLHERAGKEYLNGSIVVNYFDEISNREYKGSHGKQYHEKKRRQAERFLKFIETGEVRLANPIEGSRVILLPYYESILDDFLEQQGYHPNTRNDGRWATSKFFHWLTEQGIKDLKNVKSDELRKFLVDCAGQMAMTSVSSIKLHLSKLYAYLYKIGIAESAYSALFAFPVMRERKIPKLHTREEIAAMLDAIDRSTPIGKRAYAVMLLGIVFGLRACDIINLSLSDIDWIRGELKILQIKTSETVVLPLTTDVGEALKDYIFNARPKCSYDKIFIRIAAPYEPLKSAITIGEIYQDCCKAAGFPASKAFHNLRRSLGTAMVTTGSSAEVVAQVLGHSDVESTKKYIALDSDNLKICALSFAGIEHSPAKRKLGGGRA